MFVRVYVRASVRDFVLPCVGPYMYFGFRSYCTQRMWGTRAACIRLCVHVYILISSKFCIYFTNLLV